jgi:hypothetical protein
VATLESTSANATHWTRSKMAQRTGLSKTTIGKIWKDFGLKPHPRLRAARHHHLVRRDEHRRRHRDHQPASAAPRDRVQEVPNQDRHLAAPVWVEIVASVWRQNTTLRIDRLDSRERLGQLPATSPDQVVMRSQRPIPESSVVCGVRFASEVPRAIGAARKPVSLRRQLGAGGAGRSGPCARSGSAPVALPPARHSQVSGPAA